MPAENTIHIAICMGSSCFSRGNGRTLDAIRSYAADTGCELELVGNLCRDQCRTGPNLAVNGTQHQNVNAAAAIDLIKQASGAVRR